MRFFGARSTLWVRVLGIAVIAGALAMATGVSFGSESGNAPAYVTNAPDPVSAQVIRNGANNASGGSTNDAELQVCFDKQVQTIGSGTASDTFVGGLELYAYGAGGQAPSSERIWLGGAPATAPGPGSYQYDVTAASNPSNPNCVNVTLTPHSGATEPGVDLNSFTDVAVSEGSATGLSGLPNTPGTVGLDPVGQPEVAPQVGATTGPQITSIIKSPASPKTLTYVFNYLLDPGNVDATEFCYYASSANNQPGPLPNPTDCGVTNGATVSGNQVTVTFHNNVVNDVYYEVFPGAVFTQSTGEASPGTAVGGTIAAIPTLRSVAKVPGVAGAYDLTYDQCVVSAGHDSTQFVAVLEDNRQVSGASSSRPSSDCTKIRITFGSVNNFADYANKVVLIGDGFCAVVQNASPSNCSAVSGVPVNEAPNRMKGYTNGPNLIGFSVDKANSTATYYFDNQYGALQRNQSSPAVEDFGLLYKDGTNTLDSHSLGQGATFTGPNQVTVQFNPNQMGNSGNPIVAGLIGTGPEGDDPPPHDCSASTTYKPCDGDDAVYDYESFAAGDPGTEPASPEVSGIGIGGYQQATSTTTSSSTTTSTSQSSTTTTTTRHVVHHHKKHKKCRKGKVRRHGKCVKKHKHRRHRRR